MERRELYDVYVTISNQSIMRLQVGFRTPLRAILNVLADNFSYAGARSALVLTEVVPVSFHESHGPDFKEKVAKARLSLTLSDPKRFVKLVHDATMEECGIWEDAIIYVIIDGYESPVFEGVMSKAPTDIVTSGGGGGRGSARRGEFTPMRIANTDIYQFNAVASESKSKDSSGPKAYSELLKERFKINFLDIVQLKLLRYAHSAPKYRVYNTGVNYECTCGNADCPAYKKQVIVPVGHTSKTGNRPFDEVYLRRSIVCPLCKHAVPTIYSFGFSNCMFEWKGVTKDGVRREHRGAVQPSRYSVYSGSDAVLTASRKSTKSITGNAMEWPILIITTAIYNPDEASRLLG